MLKLLRASPAFYSLARIQHVVYTMQALELHASESYTMKPNRNKSSKLEKENNRHVI